ncbi:MAG: lysozyme inhibitor LprI family protein [Paracoccaceae bacterium]|nr:DUF1311 domain-containing protein [Loktanella sp.]
MIRNTLCAMAFAAVCAPAAAQDLAFSSDDTEICLSGGNAPDFWKTCIGQAASRCMTLSPSGDTTSGMNGCLALELDWWDAKLNTEYKRLMSEITEFDNAAGFSVADGLRDMQRAWIGYRDAICGFEAAQYGTGTLGSTITYDCLMQKTAEQALYLQQTAFVF